MTDEKTRLSPGMIALAVGIGVALGGVAPLIADAEAPMLWILTTAVAAIMGGAGLFVGSALRGDADS